MAYRSAYARWDGRFFYYALVRRGGNTVGKRIGVRMAILTDCTFGDDAKLVTARGFIGNAALNGWTKEKRGVDPADIVKKWRCRPALAVIAAVKRKLPLATEADQYCNRESRDPDYARRERERATARSQLS